MHFFYNISILFSVSYPARAFHILLSFSKDPNRWYINISIKHLLPRISAPGNRNKDQIYISYYTTLVQLPCFFRTCSSLIYFFVIPLSFIKEVLLFAHDIMVECVKQYSVHDGKFRSRDFFGGPWSNIQFVIEFSIKP